MFSDEEAGRIFRWSITCCNGEIKKMSSQSYNFMYLHEVEMIDLN